MRTRTANRTKRYTLDKYDFESSSDEQQIQTPKRRKDADERDANFDVEAEAHGEPESANDDDEDIAPDQDALNLESDEDLAELPSRSVQRQTKPNVGAAPVGYLDIEPLPAEGHNPKGYVGPYDRTFRAEILLHAWYGPQKRRLELAQAMLDRWMDWTVLPPKMPDSEITTNSKCVWDPDFREKEQYFADIWNEQAKEVLNVQDHLVPLTREESLPYRMPEGSMTVLVGPKNQHEITFAPSHTHPTSQSGIPMDQDPEETKVPSGWMLDVGGIVVGMDWARRRQKDAAQILALAVIPHSDQESYNYEQEFAKPDYQKHGVVQLWEFRGTPSGDSFSKPSTKKPRLLKTLCLDSGRARRVRWNPAALLLAILCGDGTVHIVNPGDDGNGSYDYVKRPVASLGLPDEDGVKATAMTWVSVNRLAVGYTDGSIGLWSIYPARLLTRHPVHHSTVVDIASGYPTMPYVVASTPVGGVSKLVDLRAPSYETTEVQTLLISTQPNLLAYSDHMLGFFSLYPSCNVLNIIIGFMHHAHYPLCRRVTTADSFLTCLSVGHTHPYLLAGTADGSLWALNPQVELFSRRREPSDRLKVFQHEHRSASLFPTHLPASIRGMSRILQGFAVERNKNPRAERSSNKSKKPKKGKGQPEDENDGLEGDVGDGEGGGLDPSRGIIHEPGTRLTVVEWNPNEGFGCWAAVAMASGLVRVMDLGLEVRK